MYNCTVLHTVDKDHRLVLFVSAAYKYIVLKTFRDPNDK